jgi:hypothetical protein
VLAYLFWHRPRPGVEDGAYEQAQRAFHGALEQSSACFAVDPLPFGEGAGYEDWYLVDGWAQLGDLNAAAVDARRRAHHDLAASMVGEGWGGLYAHVAGAMTIPAEASWAGKRPGRPLEEILGGVAETTPVWRRQMVLGPAPEICIGTGGPPRRRIA